MTSVTDVTAAVTSVSPLSRMGTAWALPSLSASTSTRGHALASRAAHARRRRAKIAGMRARRHAGAAGGTAIVASILPPKGCSSCTSTRDEEHAQQSVSGADGRGQAAEGGRLLVHAH